MQMDKKTKLTSSIPEFMSYWRQYKKGLKEIKGLKIINWCIASDYCFNNNNKLDVATFTIFPCSCGKILSIMSQDKLPKDIKETRKFSQESIDFLKNSKLFFSISIIINNLNSFFDQESANEQMLQSLQFYEQLPFNEKSVDTDKGYKDLKKIHAYINQKSYSKKLLSQMYFVAKFISQILEFLLIKENCTKPHWCSDRDYLISFKNGIIMKFIGSYVYRYIKGRISNFNLVLPAEINEENKTYPYDPIIRIPDILTGILSSVEMTDRGLIAQKPKHYDLFKEVIVDNPRIITLEFDVNKNGMIWGNRIFWKNPHLLTKP